MTSTLTNLVVNSHSHLTWPISCKWLTLHFCFQEIDFLNSLVFYIIISFSSFLSSNIDTSRNSVICPLSFLSLQSLSRLSHPLRVLKYHVYSDDCIYNFLTPSFCAMTPIFISVAPTSSLKAELVNSTTHPLYLDI